MSQIHPCADQSDTINLYPVLGLFLKPIARINITIHFPTLKQSLTTGGGKSVSSWEVMEKIKGLVAPDNFISLKVVKNTLEFIRFEGDLENREVLKTIITRLDGRTLKLTGFKELLKIRAAETKIPFPSKYDWDSFFRDAKYMNEMKAGERPDTIHFQCLPCKWFSDKKLVEKPMPSEKLFRRVWEIFGEVRCVDIPVLDPYRQQMQSNIAGIKTFTFSQDPVFEAYVQYKDYLSFVKAMDALRGCFLMYQENTKSWVASIKVNFDKSKHLSDDSIRRRRVERDRLMEEDKLRERLKLKQQSKGNINNKVNAEEKEGNGSAPLAKDDSSRVEYKIALEERMYMVARRKLESVRLLDYIFERIRIQRQKDMKGAGDGDDERSSQRSNVSKSDRLSPSFYSVERSPRIERCKSPRSQRSSRSRSQSNRSPRHSRDQNRNRTRSPYREKERDRSRSGSRSRTRTRSRSRSRNRSRGSRDGRSPRRDRDYSPRDSRDRSPRKERNLYSPRDDRNRDRSPRRDKDQNFSHGDGRYQYIPRDYEHHNHSNNQHFDVEGKQQFRYMNDWEIKPHRGGYRGGGRGFIPNFRGRGRGMRMRGQPYRPYYNNHDESANSLQEAYNQAYTKYFNSITRANDNSRSGGGSGHENEEDDRSEHSRTRNYSRSRSHSYTRSRSRSQSRSRI